MQTQKEGLTGHLEQAGFPFDRIGWDRYDIHTRAVNENPEWWVYEQTAYWIDGIERCGQLLRDASLLRKSTANFDYVIKHTDADGYMGPKMLKRTSGWERWPHVVFFRALMARYSVSKDAEILEKITDFYIKSNTNYSGARDVMNIEIMLCAYGINGNKALLKLAEETYAQYNENCQDDNCVSAMNSRKKISAHGVTYNEFCKLGAILCAHTGKEAYLKPVIHVFQKMDRMHMLVDGCPYSIKIPGKRVKTWHLSKRKKIQQIRDLYVKPYTFIEKNGSFSFAPRFPSKIEDADLGERETLTLVPMAVAKIRITIFPKNYIDFFISFNLYYSNIKKRDRSVYSKLPSRFCFVTHLFGQD